MSATRRVTITLPDDVVGAADQAAAGRAGSRLALVEDALRWYLRVQELPWEEATPEEIEAIERGRAEIARGEFATFEEIKRDLAADLRDERAKESKEIPASRRIDRALDELAVDPTTGDVQPLRNHPSEFRKRVGNYRIFFDLHRHERLVWVHDIVRRTSQTYRR